MRVLILGGDGFIGSHLRDNHLNKGDTVSIVDKDCFRSSKYRNYNFVQHKIVQSDITLKYIIMTNKPDLIYNCVAIANPSYYVSNPIDTFDLDFTLNYDIIQVVSEFKIPLIHFSTSEVYGKKDDNEPLNEDTSNLVLGPSTKTRWIYATSKILLEQLLISLSNRNKIECVILRPFNFIGHDIDWIPSLSKCDKFWKPRIYSCFMDNLMSGKPLKVVNPGTQTRSYTHINDAVSAIDSILSNWKMCKNKILNIGNPNNETTIINLANMMIELMNEISNTNIKYDIEKIDGDTFYGPGYDDSPKRLANIDKLRNLTNWNPTINLRDTFKKSMKLTIDKFSKK